MSLALSDIRLSEDTGVTEVDHFRRFYLQGQKEGYELTLQHTNEALYTVPDKVEVLNKGSLLVFRNGKSSEMIFVPTEFQANVHCAL